SSTVRYALVGIGAAIAPLHLKAIEGLEDAVLAGASDLVPSGRAAARAEAAGCPLFADHRELLRAVSPDVVVVCTPHPSHALVTVDALRAEAHVLVEKPLADEVAAADRMVEAAAAAGRVLAVNFQQRFRPSVERAREAVGNLGPLVRVSCSEPWFRTAAYYASAGWRGTWEGEGGGVLLNQAPHTLDLLVHLAGMPVRAWGWTRTRRHRIEVEDSAMAMLEFANGAPGSFSTSTVEAGSPRRLEVVGERGSLELVGDRLTVRSFAVPLDEFSAGSPEPFAEPPASGESLDLPGDGGGHLAVHRDLLESIASGRPPRCDGAAALGSLELANAIALSSHLEAPVPLPLDRAAYAAFLAGKRAGSVA
ncbi:MAG TPA: Gfo/Idh/MocA family oxidoreductase, partial [Deinococcales bacterium]|nr:Gfo/Idh/MocA family oxidoreductase [Deinococcales bacterium]